MKRADTPNRKSSTPPLNGTFVRFALLVGALAAMLRGVVMIVHTRTTTWGARIVHLAHSFDVRDLPAGDSVQQESASLFEVDYARFRAIVVVKRAVRSVCLQATKMYPVMGYSQGFDAACAAIFLSLKENIAATQAVYNKWAVPVTWVLWHRPVVGKSIAHKAVAYAWSIVRDNEPAVLRWLSRDPILGNCQTKDSMVDMLFITVFFEPLATFCSKLGLQKAAFRRLVEHPMGAREDGPAVTIYVVLCLLCLAEKQSTGNLEEGVVTKTPLKVAAKTVSTFSELESAAPISLKEFVAGYHAAVSDDGV